MKINNFTNLFIINQHKLIKINLTLFTVKKKHENIINNYD